VYKFWGAGIGVLAGLPFGFWAALLGGVAGAIVSAVSWQRWESRLRDDPVMQKAFFRLLGHACKLSGAIHPAHISATRDLMSQWDLSMAHQEAAIRAFNLGKAGIDAASVTARLKRRVESRAMLCWLAVGLIRVSRSAYQTSDAERALGGVLQQMGVPAGVLRLKRNPAPQASAPVVSTQAPSPWALLGVAPGTRGTELKKAYRRAIGQTHPDKIAASGGTPAQVEAAKQKSQQIQDAWARIKHHASR